MKIFLAGATGVLGRVLVPQLVARGHEVAGMTRTASKQELVRSLGARPVVADALDPDAVAQAVASAEPEVIVHELTALSGKMSLRDARHPDRSPMALMTNRLRIEGTDHLLAAGRAVGARRFVAQSFGAFRYARTGGPVLTEADPLDPNPPARPRSRCAGAPRGRPPRSHPAGGAAHRAGGDPLSRAGGDDDRVGRGSRVALWRLLRSGDRDQPGSGRGDGDANPQASVPDHRGRWWRLVARPHRRRCGGDRGCGRARPAGDLQRGGRRARPGAGLDPRAGARAGRQAAAAGAALARSAPGG